MNADRCTSKKQRRTIQPVHQQALACMDFFNRKDRVIIYEQSTDRIKINKRFISALEYKRSSNEKPDRYGSDDKELFTGRRS